MFNLPLPFTPNLKNENKNTERNGEEEKSSEKGKLHKSGPSSHQEEYINNVNIVFSAAVTRAERGVSLFVRRRMYD
jgi:hypothetical protein